MIQDTDDQTGNISRPAVLGTTAATIAAATMPGSLAAQPLTQSSENPTVPGTGLGAAVGQPGSGSGSTRDYFVIDGVAHGYNFQRENWNSEPLARGFSSALYEGFHLGHQPAGDHWRLDQDTFMERQANADLVARSLFAESPTDMAIYHPIPYFGAFKDGGSPLSVGLKMRDADPERVLLFGPVSPVRDGAMEAVDQLIEEVGVVGIKFYPLDLVNGEFKPIRLNDDQTVMPVIQRAYEKGLRHVGIHKAVPLGPTAIDPFKLEDMDAAIQAFPDVTFQIIHGGAAFLDETAMLVQRYPNVVINLEPPTTAYLNIAPRRFANILGTLIFYGGSEKLMWASGAASIHPRPLLERFFDFQIPDDMQEGLGLPALTEQDKRNILGENAARLFDIDIASKRPLLEVDRFGRTTAYDAPFSGGGAAAMEDFEIDRRYVQAVTS